MKQAREGVSNWAFAKCALCGLKCAVCSVQCPVCGVVCMRLLTYKNICAAQVIYRQRVASGKLIADGQVECTGRIGVGTRRQQNAARYELTIPIGGVTEGTVRSSNDISATQMRLSNNTYALDKRTNTCTRQAQTRHRHTGTSLARTT